MIDPPWLGRGNALKELNPELWSERTPINTSPGDEWYKGGCLGPNNLAATVEQLHGHILYIEIQG